eukprot:12995788-Alexandrium_andersonii.AAC.1
MAAGLPHSNGCRVCSHPATCKLAWGFPRLTWTGPEADSKSVPGSLEWCLLRRDNAWPDEASV